MMRPFAFAAALALVAAPVSQWPFPGLGDEADLTSLSAADAVHLSGSSLVFHRSDFDSMARAIDWFPDAHPPAPVVVTLAGGNGAYPCGYCHLPDGRGRPENASLQGLPAEYIVEQVHAFASNARRSASPDYAPTRYMAGVAHAISPSELNAAAAYFSQFEPQSHTQVIETATIPTATAWHFVYRFDRSRQEALGQRIVEGPVDPERYELRDPETRYTAYVPEGAIGRGQAAAEHGVSGGPACISCHGPKLAGIAGASPTYLARQLMGFRNKTRSDAGSESMQAVAAQLTDAQIIDLAAFAGSLPPWSHSDTP